MSLSHCLHMGGYAAYVWSAYGLASLILATNCAVIGYQRRKTIKQITQYLEAPVR